MKKITKVILIGFLSVSLSACQMSGAQIIKPETTSALQNTSDEIEETEGSTVAEALTDGSDSITTPDQITSAGEEPTTSAQTSARETTSDQTDGAATQPAETTIAQTNTGETTSGTNSITDTKPTETQAGETPPNQDYVIKSNISPEIQAELSKPENGLIIIYRTDLFKEIKAITKWNVVEYSTNSQLLLVTKKKGSRVEVSKSKITDGEEVVIPGELIRDWETTSDFEVIRIVYTDPETMPFNFIRVIEPDGQKTTLPIHTSMRDNPDWEVFQYDHE